MSSSKSRLATIWMYDPPISPLGVDPAGSRGQPDRFVVGAAGTFAVASAMADPRRESKATASLVASAVPVPTRRRRRLLMSSTLVDAANGARFLRGRASGSYVLANGKDAPIRFGERRLGFGATRWISRDDFCRLRGSRRAFVEFAEPSFDRSDDERRREHLARIDFAPAPGTPPHCLPRPAAGPNAAVKR